MKEVDKDSLMTGYYEYKGNIYVVFSIISDKNILTGGWDEKVLYSPITNTERKGLCSWGLKSFKENFKYVSDYNPRNKKAE